MENEIKSELILPASIILGAILISGSILYAGGIPAQKNTTSTGGSSDTSADITQALKLDKRDVVQGDSNAPVTVIEYADYQCPFCERFFTQVETQIKQSYIDTGKVKFVYRNFPFLDTDPQTGQPGGYKESHLTAEAAECSKDQGKFWQFHDLLYVAEGKDAKENNGNLNRALFIQLATQAGMNTGTFTQCFDSHKYAATILSDAQSAGKVGVNGTPTVFVNGARLSGVDPANPSGQYKAAIDNALKSL